MSAVRPGPAKTSLFAKTPTYARKVLVDGILHRKLVQVRVKDAGHAFRRVCSVPHLVVLRQHLRRYGVPLDCERNSQLCICEPSIIISSNLSTSGCPSPRAPAAKLGRYRCEPTLEQKGLKWYLRRADTRSGKLLPQHNCPKGCAKQPPQISSFLVADERRGGALGLTCWLLPNPPPPQHAPRQGGVRIFAGASSSRHDQRHEARRCRYYLNVYRRKSHSWLSQDPLTFYDDCTLVLNFCVSAFSFSDIGFAVSLPFCSPHSLLPHNGIFHSMVRVTKDGVGSHSDFSIGIRLVWPQGRC